MEVENDLIDYNNGVKRSRANNKFNISEPLSLYLTDMSKWIRRLLISTAVYMVIYFLCSILLVFVCIPFFSEPMKASSEVMSVDPFPFTTAFVIFISVVMVLALFILLKLWKGQKFIKHSIQKRDEELLFRGVTDILKYWKYNFYLQIISVVIIFLSFLVKFILN